MASLPLNRKKSPGQAICEALVKEDVRFVFGLAGSHILGVLDALSEITSPRFISCKHENNAAVMADVHGRLTGKPGVVLVSAGPGATNTMTGVAQAYASATPMIHLSGTVPSDGSLESFHGVDRRDFLVRMFEPITKWSISIDSPARVPEILAEAFRLATTGRPGPVHVEIPWDVLHAPPSEIPGYVREPCREPEPEPDLVHALARRLLKSRRTVIWAGKGVQLDFAHRELAELAELLDAPVMSADDVSGAIPDTHPLSTGQLSLYTRSPLQKALMSEADLVLCIGERGGTVHANTLFELAGKTPVCGFWLGGPGEQPDRRSALGSVTPTGNGLLQLVVACRGLGRKPDPVLRSRIHDGKNGLRDRILERVCSSQVPAGMHPAQALLPLAEFVDEDLICVGDIGEHNQWTRLLISSHSRDTYLQEGFWGAMGFSLPGAIAAKLCHPSKKVIGVTGDGCFLMACSDFATALELGANPVILVINDHRYSMIAEMQVRTYGRSMGTELHIPDLVAFARSFGGDGVRVERPEHMRAALEQGFRSPVIFVIDAICGYDPAFYRSPSSLFED